MGKRLLTYLIVIIITVGALLLVQYSKPKEINWFPSFVNGHKIPYGTTVFNDYIETEFESTRQVYIPPFEFLSEQDTTEGTYIFINEDVSFGQAELDRILNWTSKGNTLFIASDDFETQLLDTLGLEVENLYNDFEHISAYEHQLVNKNLKHRKKFLFEKDPYIRVFSKDSLPETTILGTVSAKNDSTNLEIAHFNVVQKKFGDGAIILSTFPKAFTNYFILKDDNKDYTAGLISYWDDTKTVYLDNHHKSGKSIYTSPMYIFLNFKEFKWAYYVALIGVLLYVLFEGKRKQRAIPVVTPLKNQTLAFTRTIANMYYESGESKAIAQHKIDYFFDYLRNKFYFKTVEENDQFYKNVASRSGHSAEEIEQLFKYIHLIRSKETITNSELQQLSAHIDKFKKQANGN